MKATATVYHPEGPETFRVDTDEVEMIFEARGVLVVVRKSEVLTFGSVPFTLLRDRKEKEEKKTS